MTVRGRCDAWAPSSVANTMGRRSRWLGRRPWRLMGILVQFCRSSLPPSFLPSFLAPPRPPCVRRHWRLPIFPFVKKRGEIPVDVATQPRHLLAPPSGHAMMCFMMLRRCLRRRNYFNATRSLAVSRTRPTQFAVPCFHRRNRCLSPTNAHIPF